MSSIIHVLFLHVPFLNIKLNCSILYVKRSRLWVRIKYCHSVSGSLILLSTNLLMHQIPPNGGYSIFCTKVRVFIVSHRLLHDQPNSVNARMY